MEKEIIATVKAIEVDSDAKAQAVEVWQRPPLHAPFPLNGFDGYRFIRIYF